MPKKEVWDTYPEIYHYTNFSSTLLIIHSATLRATRFDSLNDTQEIIYAKKIISQKLRELSTGDTLEGRQNVADLLHNTGKQCDFYITSFCGKNSDIDPYHRENGLLSMWRNYGSDGGCALIFKTKNIYDGTCNYGKPKKKPSLIMGEVNYEGHNNDESDYCEILYRHAKNISNFEKNYNDNISHNMGDLSIDQSQLMIEDQLQLMVLTKHPAFHEELEVRIGLIYYREEPETNSQSIPKQYHSIPFAPDKDISGIIIGPHRNQQERCRFLKSYLSKFGLKNIEVTKSEIPLRT